jgi:hypothetical protein
MNGNGSLTKWLIGLAAPSLFAAAVPWFHSTNTQLTQHGQQIAVLEIELHHMNDKLVKVLERKAHDNRCQHQAPSDPRGLHRRRCGPRPADLQPRRHAAEDRSADSRRGPPAIRTPIDLVGLSRKLAAAEGEVGAEDYSLAPASLRSSTSEVCLLVVAHRKALIKERHVSEIRNAAGASATVC